MVPLFFQGNHTFTAVRGHESYELLSAAFFPVFEEINEALADPCIIVDEVEWELDIVFGSDYKVCTNHTHRYHEDCIHRRYLPSTNAIHSFLIRLLEQVYENNCEPFH